MRPRKSSNRKIHSGQALASVFALACLAVASFAAAQQPNAAPKVVVDLDGTVHMPAQIVPVSSYLSTEGKAYLAEHLIQVQRPEMLVQEGGVPPLLAGYLARQRERSPSPKTTRRWAASTRSSIRRRTGSRRRIATAC